MEPQLATLAHEAWDEILKSHQMDCLNINPQHLQESLEISGVSYAQLMDWLTLFPEVVQLEPNAKHLFAHLGKVVFIPEGGSILKEGLPVENMFMLCQGEIEVSFKTEGNFTNSLTIVPGEINGLLPFSRLATAKGSSKALSGGAYVFQIHKKHFVDIANLSYELMQSLIGRMIDRSKESTRFAQQQEKLMSLGKLSAGLAHELNNPAAAMVRSSDALKKHLSHVPAKFKAVMKIRVSDAEVDLVNEILFRRLAAGFQDELPLKERMKLEQAMVDWLDDHAISQPEEIAETFLSLLISIEELESIAAVVPAGNLDAVLTWMDNVITTDRLVQEIGESAQKIGTLVSSVKSYTHMDAANDLQSADLYTGIKSTLTMLIHKIKVNNINLVKVWPADIPLALVRIGEINQVFTNIIDNAIDALVGVPNPILNISAEYDDKYITVSIIDNGPGIPDEVKDRIFDPFFTTKEIGKGTGLGLDIARRIVKGHKGEIGINTRPGHTEFWVCLPRA